MDNRPTAALEPTMLIPRAIPNSRQKREQARNFAWVEGFRRLG